MVDFIVITSNAPHLIKEFIEEAAGRPVLSMIEATLSEIKRRDIQRIGVLGLGEPVVYLRPLEELGIQYETLLGEPGGLREGLDGAILALMAGQTSLQTQALAKQAVDALRARDVEAVILGCTEIPLLLGNENLAPDLINPAQLLAEAAVRFAIE